jgi:uncharacterized membrane protein
MEAIMFIKAYQKAFGVLSKKPMRLWGLSILVTLICVLAALFSSPFFLIVGIAYGMVVTAGMAKVYLDALDNKEVNSDQIFAGFKRFWTVLGGLAWKALWSVLWVCIAAVAGLFVFGMFALIGASIKQALGIMLMIGGILGGLVFVAGLVFAYIKILGYRFVEYILLTDSSVSATQALRKSVELTKGKKLQFFLADLIYECVVSVTIGLFSGMALIPYAGFLFGILAMVFGLVFTLFGPLFQGLYSAAFYKLTLEERNSTAA